jgi:hypothetical protein
VNGRKIITPATAAVMLTVITAPTIGPMTAGSHGPILICPLSKLCLLLLLRQPISRGFTLATPAHRARLHIGSGISNRTLTHCCPTGRGPLQSIRKAVEMPFSFVLVMFVLPAAIIATAVLLASALKQRAD